MRRLLLAALSVLAAGALVVALTGAGGDPEAKTFRVDALFDNAGFLIPGQDVKVAGAKVGKVVGVRLTKDRKARIEMDVDGRFAPFRSDADCTIQPQSLIGEKFLQCTPGTPRGRPLVARGDVPPTVPLARTHSPIDLDLVLAALRQPTTTRASLLISALGAGLTGQAGNLNDAIRRADPAFAEVQRLLTQVNGERTTIRELIGSTDQVLRVLARRRGDVADFVTGARRVTDTTAARAEELRATLRGLPALLDEAEPALAELRRLGEQGTPVVAQLRRAAPDADRLVRQLAPFSAQATPTLAALGTTAKVGRGALTTAAPQVRRLHRFATVARPAGTELRALFESMQAQGAVEGLFRFVYWTTAALSRFDAVSHILPAYLQAVDTCNLYATTTVKSCSTHFATGDVAARARAKTKRPARLTDDAATAAPATTAAPDASAPSATPAPPAALPDLPKAVHDLPKQLQDTIDGLLHPGRGRTPKSSEPAPANPAGGLLDFLLGG